MLFFDTEQLAAIRSRFAKARWPDFSDEFLLQPAPSTLKPYDVLRWDGKQLARATTTDAKFAAWVITENTMAFALGRDPRYLQSAVAWVEAALATDPWQPQFVGNTDLYHGNLLYALSFFLDLCGDAIDVELRSRVIEKLIERGRAAHSWFAGREPAEQRYTQNHFYIPLVGLVCAALVVRDLGDGDPVLKDRLGGKVASWIQTARPYFPLIFDALGEDGWFFEGPDYWHYAFVWVVRLAELCRRHFELDVSHKPCFTLLKHFLRWTYFPKGDWQFSVGDASAKQWNFSSWSEHETGQGLASDNHLQNFAHLLHWVAWRTGDEENRTLANEIHSRGSFRWNEGFWALVWSPSPLQGEGRGEGRSDRSPDTIASETSMPGESFDPHPNPLPARERGQYHPHPNPLPAREREHLFHDFNVFCIDRALPNNRTLRLLTKCGPPAGRSIFKDGKPIYNYDAGHAHPDAGTVLAALDDVPILLGPGYLGRKSGTYQNTLTFDGRGQGDDRLYHALNPESVDYARLMKLSIQHDQNSVRMSFAEAYDPAIGVIKAHRTVEFASDDANRAMVDSSRSTGFQPVPGPQGTGWKPVLQENRNCDARDLFTITDEVQLSIPRRPEARFRISDPPIETARDFVRWRVGGHVFEMRVAEASAEFQLFVQIGEVITMNDTGRSGPFEAGDVNQRGYQIVVRPRECVTAWRMTLALRFVRP